MLTDNQLERYTRHIILQNIVIDGQEKLLQYKVLIIGSGSIVASMTDKNIKSFRIQNGVVENKELKIVR